MLKSEPERQGFQHLPRGPADVSGSGFNTSLGAQQMLMYQKSMFDCYYCIKTFFFARKTLNKLLQKVLFTCIIMAQKSILLANIFKMSLPGQWLTSSLLCTLLMMTSVFMMAPECLFIKPQSCALTDLLIHGFVLVKTWLLIACNTPFYAIIFIHFMTAFFILT